jgi:hypothetical protein
VRLALPVLALVAGAGAWYLTAAAKSSPYGSYSTDQLRTLERGYESVVVNAPVSGADRISVAASSPAQKRLQDRSERAQDAAMDARASLSLIHDERRRRMLSQGALALAGLAAIGTLLIRGRAGFRDRSEEMRLTKTMGSPTLLLEGERHKAARLLGVSLDAPSNVVEAAFNAQVAARDPSRMDGLAPDLRRLAREQRDSLARARDLLLGRATSPR